MRAISIHKLDDHLINQTLTALGDNLRVDVVAPSIFSFVTSMRLRKILDSRGANNIIAYTIKDAMAAISAREISRNNDVKITLWVMPNTPIPRGIPADIRLGVDRWVFATDRLRSAFPRDLKNVALGMPCIDMPSMTKVPNDGQNYLWIGAIDGNTDRLKLAIKTIDNTPDSTLTICGTGKARNTMPAVQMSRAISQPERVIWRGNDFQLTEEIAKASALVQAGLDPDPMEASFNLPMLSPQLKPLGPYQFATVETLFL